MHGVPCRQNESEVSKTVFAHNNEQFVNRNYQHTHTHKRARETERVKGELHRHCLALMEESPHFPTN